MADPLEIPINLDKGPAKAAAEAFRADMRALNQGLAADTKRASAEEIAEAKRVADARKSVKTAQTEGEIRLARRAAEEEGIGIRSLKQARQEASEEAVKSFEKTTKSGVDSMTAIAGAATAIGAVAFRALTQTISGIANELDRVGQKSREMSNKFASDRDKLRELAAVEGKQADSGYTLGMHQFAKENALSFDEAVGFRTNFANVGQQFKGRNISESEYDQYQSLSAANASRTNASPEAAALFAGSFLTKDLKKHGAKAAEEAFRQQYQVGSVYDAGEGSATQNFGAFAALKKEFESDPNLKTAFKSDLELATVGSIANAAGPDRQREQISALIRNLRDDDNKELSALKKKVGLGADASIQEIVTGIAPELQKEAVTKGKGIDQIIGGYIPDRQAREALSIQINQGITGGGYAQRAKVAAEAGKAGLGEAALETYKGTEVAQQRMGDADVASAQAERAAKNSELTILRREALARMIREERIDTNATGINDYLNQKGSFGLVGSAEQKRIDDEVQRTLKARAGGDLDTVSLAITPEAREKELREQIEAVKKKGVNPLLSGGEIIERDDAFSPIGKLFTEGLGLFNDLTQEKRFPEAAGARGSAVPNNASSNVGPDGRPREAAPDPMMKEQTELLRKIADQGAPAGPNRAPAPIPLIGKTVAARR